MRQRIVILVALAALAMSALPTAAVEAPDTEGPHARSADVVDETIKTTDRIESATDSEDAELVQRAEELAAESEPDTHIVQFESPAVPTYFGGIEGLESTAPESDGLDTDDSSVVAYREHLATEQAEGVEAISEALDRDVSPDRSYDLAINAVAVELAPDEAARVLRLPEVGWVNRQQFYELQTDAGPDHMNADAIWDGDYDEAPEDGARGEGVVIGVIDSGITPDNPSFAEVGPVDGYEHEWADSYFGVCDDDDEDYDPEFPCNNKLIGAWGLTADNDPVDFGDHGTHTASTAAGNVVDVSLGPDIDPQELQISGVAPHAHVISYRVCGEGVEAGCPLDAIIDGIDQAIDDEVDVINYSIGGGLPSMDLWDAAENLAWLNANGAGVHVAHSAGNAGPGDATAFRSGDLPWVTSVGASEHYRAIENYLIDITASGDTTLNDIAAKGFTGPLESGTTVVYDTDNPHCYSPVDEELATSAIVLCDRGATNPPLGRIEASENVAEAGGAGFVLMNTEEQADSVHGDEFAVPGVHVSYEHGEDLKNLVADYGEVTAGVRGYEFNPENPHTDWQATFSSRGPNQAVQTLVPNLTAPGLDIVGAIDPDEEGEPRWGVISGTSMSSPHVAGAYGLLTEARGSWSPAEAQSALQLTARDGTPKEDGTDGDPHSEGAGYTELSAAVDAGFVMDITQQGYEAANPEAEPPGDVRQLNYPELVNFDLADNYTWNRTLSSTQAETVTWEVNYDADDGISLDGPGEVTIDPGADETLAVSIAVDEQTSVAETLFGRVTLIATNVDLPDAHMPLAVTIAEPISELTVDPTAIEATQGPGEVTEHALTVSNTGNTDRSWTVTEENDGRVWHQPATGRQGVASDYFIGESDAGAYATDDFIVGDGTNLGSIFVSGRWQPAQPGTIAEAEALTWYIYPDLHGLPAGHPGDGEENHAWTFSAEPGDNGVLIEDEDVTLNVDASDAEPVELESGTYWIVFFPDILEDPDNMARRWNWLYGTSQLDTGKQLDPEGMFGNPSEEWQDISEGLSFTLSAEFACTMPEHVDWLDLDATNGDLGSGDSQEVDVTFDASTLDVGTYTETLCIGTDEDLVFPITLSTEVVNYGTIQGTVTAADTGEPVEGATVIAEGTAAETTTSEDGEYELERVPAGERRILANAGGHAHQTQLVTVEDSASTEGVDFELQPLPPMIGIAGDNGGQLAGLLDDHALPNMRFSWDDDVADFSAIVLNWPGDPGEEMFLDFIEDADQAGTGLVMLDTWTGNGVELLHTHLDNPGVRETGGGFSNDGHLSYQVTEEHPVVDGYNVDDEIIFDATSGDFDYAWFDDYTGDGVTLIADAIAGGDTLGRGIAVEDRETTRHALLSMHGASLWAGPEYWEPGGVQVFLNALEWVSDDLELDDPELVNVSVEPGEAEIEVGESVQWRATAVYSNRPDIDVTDQADWASDNEDIATVAAGEVTGVAAGDASITATFDEESDSATVTVLPDGPALMLEPDTFSLEVTEGAEADETLTIVNGGDELLEWELSEAVPIETTSGFAPAATEPTVLTRASGSVSAGADDANLTVQDLEDAEPQRFSHQPVEPAQDEVTITHSESMDIAELNSASCGTDSGTTQNAFLRTFTLADFSINTDFSVTEVVFGVEGHHGPAVTADINLYQLEAGDDFIYENLDELGTSEVQLNEGLIGQLVTVPVEGTVEGGSTLVVEVDVPPVQFPLGGFYIGSNPDGQTAPSYLVGPECGLDEPTDATEIGFEDMHIAMSVAGEVAPAACDNPSDLSWLSANPTSGSVAPDASSEAALTVDATNLNVGNYDALVCVSTNDHRASLVEVPFNLTVTEPDALLESVVVEPSEASIVVGGTAELTATAHYDNGDEADVTNHANWISADSRVVTVDAGVVAGVAEGEADVTAEFDGESGSAEVTVSEDDVPPPEDPVDLVVTPSEATIGIDGVAQFEATAIYDDDQSVDVTEDAGWVSGDEDVATVDGAGLVAGVAEGTAEVTATFEDLSDSSSVTVDAEVEPGPEGLERISAEPGRVEVAIAASQHRFGDGETNAVVLARADEYPDALAGTTLAAEVDAPLLLTSSDELLGNVAEEVSRVLGDDGAVYLTGGTAALDDTVEGAVDELGYQTMRLGGETRFETAGLIAEELGERSQVLVTTGLDFPDALTAGAAASANDGVVLLSAGEDPHDVVDDYLDGFDGEVTAVGGPATRAYPDAHAVMGATRDETAVAVAEAFFDEPVAFGVARRDDYPDALAGGAHIAAYEGPLLLTYTEDVPEETAQWLTETNAAGGFVYGGTAAVSEGTFDELEDLTFGDNDNDDEGQ